MFRITGSLFVFLFITSVYGAKYTVKSPDKKVHLTVNVGRTIIQSLKYDGKILLSDSPISMRIRGKDDLGRNARVKRAKRHSHREVLRPVLKVKSAEILDHYNALRLEFNGYALSFRVYNNGAAYRFETAYDDTIEVISEEVSYRFTGPHTVYFPEEDSFQTHSERLYRHLPMDSLTSENMSCLPVLVETDTGPVLGILESDLHDYPGLYMEGTGGPAFRGLFPAYALEEKQTRDRDIHVSKRADFIARTKGNRSFPWRILAIAPEHGDLLTNQLVYQLAGHCELQDTEWIRPGKVAWDWWNANNLYGVGFRAGLNTETYKYTIDFASRYGIEYIILDEGWSPTTNILKVNPDIDMKQLLAHAKEKDVGIILWVVWKTLDDQLEEALDLFESWGIKGIKVDFMQRDDQWMVNYYHRIAKAAAEHHLLVDFHGSYKPAGLRRRYPNVLTREGVKGLENVKWSRQPDPELNTILPFTRMLAGPMDYTPGAMRNAQKNNFSPFFTRPMSLGTRCHQLALYAIMESPLQMLADSPSNYEREPESMSFLAPVPAIWDETLVLDARIGKTIALARRSGKEWYIGAITDWSPREMEIHFDFLEKGKFRASIFMDGVNADRHAEDYSMIEEMVHAGKMIKIRLAPGGGWAARLTPLDENLE
jgi:alpha-glucosidase